MASMKLTGQYELRVTGDVSKLGVGYDHKSIGYLMQRLLTGEDADMANLENLGIKVELVDEYIAIPRMK